MRLPVYNNSSTITSEPRTRAVDYSGVAKSVAQGFEAYNQWQRIQDAADAIDGKNKLRDMYTAINNEAEGYTGYESEKDIQAKRQELKNRMVKVLPEVVSKFGNSVFGKKFAEDFKLTEQKQMVKLDAIFRQKTMDNFMAAANKSYTSNMNSFIATGDEAYQKAFMTDMENGYRAGLISKEEKERQAERVKSWHEPYLMNMAEKDPDGFIKNIDEYNKRFKNVDAVKVALAAAHRQAAWQDFNMRRDQAKNFKQMMADLDEQSLTDGMLNIDNNVSAKAISEEQGEQLKKMLNAKNGVNAQTMAKEYGNVLRDVASLEKKVSLYGKDPTLEQNEDILKHSQEILNNIAYLSSKGKLSAGDKKTLLKTLDGIREGVFLKMKTDDSGKKWWVTEFTFSDAWNYIKARMPSNIDRDEVFRQYSIAVVANTQEDSVLNASVLTPLLDGLIEGQRKNAFDRLLYSGEM